IDLTGPAADINLSGEIDLAGRELQLTAGVVPKVTESLPLAVSIGSVGLGAAVYIGQKLLGNRIENVTMLNYEISGPLEEPAVKSTGERRIRSLLRGGRGSD
ncbi:MAG: AsmA-like C-terminal region-containing protein, partial [Gammaproteobacteria bacterium]